MIAGSLLCIVFGGLALFGFVKIVWADVLRVLFNFEHPMDKYLIYLTFASLGMLPGLELRRKARRHLVKIIGSPKEFDERPFVLYLRSFNDDERVAEGTWVSDLGPSHLPTVFLHTGRSEEEQLTASLKRVGTVVAVGAPGEQIPPVGARRMYLPRQNWQKPVTELMLKARMVVLALGHSAGTMWELGEALRILSPERLLLIVPMSYEKYSEFRQSAESELQALAAQIQRDTGEDWSPPSLPEYGSSRGGASTIIRGAICYSPRWTPTFVDLSERTMNPFWDTLHFELRNRLRPIFEQLATHELRSIEQSADVTRVDEIVPPRNFLKRSSTLQIGSAQQRDLRRGAATACIFVRSG